MPLEQFLPFQVHVFFIVFARIGGLVYFLPSIGEAYVSLKIRLMFALALTFIILPLVADQIPAAPPSAMGLFALVMTELVIGLFFGFIPRLMLLTLDTTGQLMSHSIGFANAQVFNPSISSQGSIAGLLLSTIGIVVILGTNLHHMLILGIVDSYQTFAPGARVPTEDFAIQMSRLVGESFKIAVQLASPFIVFSLLFFVSLGIVARLMPQLQVFFIGLPIQIYVGITVLSVVLGGLMSVFVSYYYANVVEFFTPG